MKVIPNHFRYSSVMEELRYKLEKSIEFRRKYYETKSLKELSQLFMCAIRHRGWVFDCLGQEDIFYRSRQDPFYRSKREVHIFDPRTLTWRIGVSEDVIRRFISRYLALLDKKYEVAAQRLLESLEISRLTIQDAYDLYMRLTQVSMSRIS